ncbi:MAG TPA: M13 family metallopeptidase N-terminal domain-containing protein, partial [Terriglobales bacterium]|nr:M13 family metallopeptidase N-terminal domain-containing protein [Terriglobales bacterium]
MSIISKKALVRATVALLAASTAMSVTSVAQGAQLAATYPDKKPALGTWGVDLNERDLSVKPGDDFQKYASGTWLKKTAIPADKPEVGSFYDVYDMSQDQLKALVTSAPATSKYGALYQSMMDEKRVEELGIKPLKPDLAKVAAIKTKAQFARHMGTTEGRFGSALFAFDLEPDTADASMNSVYLYQAGLGMPNRDYYLDASFKPQRDAYRAYLERTFKAIGNSNPAAA